MKFFNKLTFVFFVALMLPLSAQAQNYPNPQSLYVNDFANIIGAQSEERIEVMLRAAKKDRDLEITVVTIDRQSDYGGTGSFKTFAVGLFNKWGIGNALRNDGILILVSKGDRKMRIVLGDGYPARYDDRAKTVIDSYFLPYFKQDRYASGIESGTKETLKRLALDYGPDNRATLKSRIKNEGTHVVDNARGGGLWAWMLGIFGDR